MSIQPLNTVLDHLFRHEYTKLISYLTAKFGPSNIDLIEDAVQEALLKAMQVWAYSEMPDNPGKWLYRVSYNKLIDVLRRQEKSVAYNPEIGSDEMVEDAEFDEGIKDSQLKMIFACCHPEIPENDRIMLSLKLLCGFDNKEIGRALLKNSETVKKGLTRAKIKFKNQIGSIEIPNELDLNDRLDSVLRVIYLVFNNGYTAYDSDELLKRDVCEDALRLAGLLHNFQPCDTPKVRALIALMSFQLSRFAARVSSDKELLTLKEQDWSIWDRELIELGNRFLESAVSELDYSTYHLEAAIAREYSISKNYDEINWKNILSIYDVLTQRTTSDIVRINRLVVLANVEGYKIALDELNLLESKKLLENHYYHSIKGYFEQELSISSYIKSFKRAYELATNEKEKEFLRRKAKQ